MITAIVAYNERRVIGDADGKIPWRIPEEMRHFKETTLGHPVIMGRKTWDSLPPKFRPLPGRMNIVLSRGSLPIDDEPDPEKGRWVEPSLSQAIQLAEQLQWHKEIFVIGGGQVYQRALDEGLVDRVLASEIKGHLDVQGAAFFPPLVGKWSRTVLHQCDQFDIVEYKKEL